jgi:hypothetical protein
LWQPYRYEPGEWYEQKQQLISGEADAARQSGGWEWNLGNAVCAESIERMKVQLK